MKSTSIALATLFVLSCTVPANSAIVSRTNFSKFGQGNCSGIASCGVDFGVVPAKHIYEIRNVSCYFAIGNAAGRPLYLYFTAFKQVPQAQYGQIHMQPAFLGTSSNSVTFNATASALVRAPAGAQLAVSSTRDGSTAGDFPFMQCTISGVDIKLK